jgi:hypothetical protein
MKAQLLTEHGGPEKLVIGDAPDLVSRGFGVRPRYRHELLTAAAPSHAR